MKSELYLLLDHQQSLLQQYRSLTVMFQTLLIALAICFLTYFSNAANLPHLVPYAVCYLILCVVGLFVSVSMAITCMVRSVYVDAVQRFIYAAEGGHLKITGQVPWLSLLRYVQSKRREIEGFEGIYNVIDEARNSAYLYRRGHARITFTYIFHGIFVLTWGVFLIDAIRVIWPRLGSG